MSKRIDVPDLPDGAGQISMVYTNYRGETSERTIRPASLVWKSTEYHPEPQWILRAFDLGKVAMRDFALSDANFKRKSPWSYDLTAAPEGRLLLSFKDRSDHPMIAEGSRYHSHFLTDRGAVQPYAWMVAIPPAPLPDEKQRRAAALSELVEQSSDML